MGSAKKGCGGLRCSLLGGEQLGDVRDATSRGDVGADSDDVFVDGGG